MTRERKIDGLLPRRQWLKTHGYSGLVCVLERNPNAFAHIPQDCRKRLTPEQWLPFAEKLARQHGGMLPSPRWLADNGLHGLLRAKDLRPELFKHIPQDSKRGRSPREWVPIAEDLARRHNGSLPTAAWLKSHELVGLDHARREHPELFKHLAQDRRQCRSPEEWLSVARTLAAKHGGAIPDSAWLKAHKLGGLLSALRAQPDVFRHLPRHRQHHSTAEWVNVAEALARQHHGVLPTKAWINQHNRSGLVYAIGEHPDLFQHIQQDRRQSRSPKEWVLVANKLAHTHGGVLPSRRWLITHKLSGLASAKHQYPNLFKHIRQNKICRTPEEWVPVAERLARQHGGVLPHGAWLIAHRFGGLDQARHAHPKLFKHIPQDKAFRAPREWVPIAEQLAKQHGGEVPISRWLTAHKLGGLDQARRAHPQLFKHIPQAKKGRSPQEWVTIAEQLVKQHGGVLPVGEWLRTHKLGGLAHAISRLPKLFKHIPQAQGKPGPKPL